MQDRSLFEWVQDKKQTWGTALYSVTPHDFPSKVSIVKGEHSPVPWSTRMKSRSWAASALISASTSCSSLAKQRRFSTSISYGILYCAVPAFLPEQKHPWKHLVRFLALSFCSGSCELWNENGAYLQSNWLFRSGMYIAHYRRCFWPPFEWWVCLNTQSIAQRWYSEILQKRPFLILFSRQEKPHITQSSSTAFQILRSLLRMDTTGTVASETLICSTTV